MVVRFRALFAIQVTLATLSPAVASVTDFTLFVNTTYNQTTSSPPVTPAGYWISLGGGMQNPGDFNTASVTYPGPGSPANLPISGTSFGFSTPYFSSLAALQLQYPFGTYTYTATNTITSTSQIGALNYAANLFTSNIPALSSSTFTGLTGLNPAAPFNAGFNSFTPAAGSSEGFTFFTVYDGTTGNVVFTNGFLSPSTTGVTIPANTLLANHSYNFELDFSDRLDGFDSVHQTFTEQGFDIRTDGSFRTGAAVTGVPEPASGALLLTGFVAAALKRSRTTKASLQK